MCGAEAPLVGVDALRREIFSALVLKPPEQILQIKRPHIEQIRVIQNTEHLRAGGSQRSGCIGVHQALFSGPDPVFGEGFS